jgi:hypothetical protein
MRCVKCGEPIRSLDEPCPHCQFRGDPALIEELGYIKWLLGQIDSLNKIGIPNVRLAEFYRARQRELEIQLGFRLPALTPDQVWQTQAALVQREAILRKIDEWLAVGLINRDAIQPILAETRVSARPAKATRKFRAPPFIRAQIQTILKSLNFSCWARAELARATVSHLRKQKNVHARRSSLRKNNSKSNWVCANRSQRQHAYHQND